MFKISYKILPFFIRILSSYQKILNKIEDLGSWTSHSGKVKFFIRHQFQFFIICKKGPSLVLLGPLSNTQVIKVICFLFYSFILRSQNTRKNTPKHNSTCSWQKSFSFVRTREKKVEKSEQHKSRREATRKERKRRKEYKKVQLQNEQNGLFRTACLFVSDR